MSSISAAESRSDRGVWGLQPPKIRQPSTSKPRNTISYSDDEDYVPPLKTFAEWEYKPVVLEGKRARAAVKYS